MFLVILISTISIFIRFIKYNILFQGYTDEPISKILTNISHSDTVLLDRWCLDVESNPNGDQRNDGKDTLPLSVVNNYYSLGVDAHIALEFHEARGKFNFLYSRLWHFSLNLVILESKFL